MKYPVTYISQSLKMMRALLVSYVVTALFLLLTADASKVGYWQFWFRRHQKLRMAWISPEAEGKCQRQIYL